MVQASRSVLSLTHGGRVWLADGRDAGNGHGVAGHFNLFTGLGAVQGTNSSASTSTWFALGEVEATKPGCQLADPMTHAHASGVASGEGHWQCHQHRPR